MTGLVYKDYVAETASNKPNAATAFNLPGTATAPARTFASALSSGNTFIYSATNGTDWETGIGTYTSGSPGTITRSKILQSSNSNAAVDWSAGGSVYIVLTWLSDIASETDLGLRGVIPGGRLTLASGDPDYAPSNTVAVSGQDAAADTITVTAHGWVSGTMVKSDATSGGITIHTTYYVNVADDNTVSLHTTLSDALAGTSKLNITGTVTANIRAVGMSNTSIFYAPYTHNLITLWDGYRWKAIEFSNTELALGTVTSGKPYDIFAYLSSGALALEILVWTDDTTRATAVTQQDGRWCKSGDKTRLLLGTLYTVSTTAAEKSQGNVYFCNLYNQIEFSAFAYDTTESWTYTTATWRQANNSTVNQINICLPIDDIPITARHAVTVQNSTSTVRAVLQGLGIDSVSVPDQRLIRMQLPSSTIVPRPVIDFSVDGIKAGKHYIAALEKGSGSDTQSWFSFRASTLVFDAYLMAIIPS